MVNLKGYFWLLMSNLLPKMNWLVMQCSERFTPHQWRHWITRPIRPRCKQKLNSTPVAHQKFKEEEHCNVKRSPHAYLHGQHNVAGTHFTHHLNVHTWWIVLKGVFTSRSVTLQTILIIVISNSHQTSHSSSGLHFICETDRGTRCIIYISVYSVESDKVALYTWCAHSRLKYVVKNTFREHL